MKNIIFIISIACSVCVFADEIDDMLNIDSMYSGIPTITEVPAEIHENGECLDESVDEYEDSEDIFIDKRMVLNDDTIIANTETVQKWKKIYSENKEYTLEKVVPTFRKKIIAEAKVSESRDYSILDRNIAFYRTKNYAGVLVTFDKTNSLDDVIAMVSHLNGVGMPVWLAYSGNDSYTESVFMDPEVFEQILKYCAPHIEAFLMGWRRTACHLWKQDAEYVNYVCKTLRDVNPKLPIFGEYYYGENSDSEPYRSVATLFKPGMSGVVISSAALMKINKKSIADAAAKAIRRKDELMIGLVIGNKIGYLTDGSGNTYEQNLNMKRKMERAFINAGCRVTITIQNDGTENATQDLMKTPYDTLNSK